jgi:hypothetical protein
MSAHEPENFPTRVGRTGTCRKNSLARIPRVEELDLPPTRKELSITFWLKLALQTLREHDQDAYVLFVDLVKAYDTASQPRNAMADPRTTGCSPQNDSSSPKALRRRDDPYENFGTKTESFGVKQGDNLGPILFIFVIQAVSITLDKKWTFQKPDFRWRPLLLDQRELFKIYFWVDD